MAEEEIIRDSGCVDCPETAQNGPTAADNVEDGSESLTAEKVSSWVPISDEALADAEDARSRIDIALRLAPGSPSGKKVSRAYWKGVNAALAAIREGRLILEDGEIRVR